MEPCNSSRACVCWTAAVKEGLAIYSPGLFSVTLSPASNILNSIMKWWCCWAVEGCAQHKLSYENLDIRCPSAAPLKCATMLSGWSLCQFQRSRCHVCWYLGLRHEQHVSGVTYGLFVRRKHTVPWRTARARLHKPVNFSCSPSCLCPTLQQK